MTARIPLERDPRSPWLSGVAEIVRYSGRSADDVGEALRDGSLRGTQKVRGGKWRTHTLWVDAWQAGEPAPSITSSRRAS